jgi:hypothetical protein
MASAPFILTQSRDLSNEEDIGGNVGNYVWTSRIARAGPVNVAWQITRKIGKVDSAIAHAILWQ